MKSVYCIVLTIISGFYCSVNPQDIASDPVARVGLKNISQEEFIKRYEFTPWLERQNKSKSQTSKLEFLYTLIAEKLWAQEATILGLDKTEVMEFTKSEFNKLFVRDALYKKEITDKIQISNQEMAEGFNRFNTKLKVNFIFSDSDTEINNLYALLNNGLMFDTLLSYRPEASEQVDPIDVVYGQMDNTIEDSLYSLSIGEYTAPIFTPDGWYIFKLSNRIESLLPLGSEMIDSKKEVERIIKARKSNILYADYFKTFFSDKEIKVNPSLFKILAGDISARFKWKYENNLISDSLRFRLQTEDVLFIEENIDENILNMNYLDFNSEPISLKQFIRILVFDGFVTDGYDITTVSAFLNKKIRSIIEQELLSREGFKRGYNLLPEVEAETNMWVDNYLFQVLKNKFLDSVYISDAKVYAYYQSTTDDKDQLTKGIQLNDIKKDELKRKLSFQKATGIMNNYTVNLALKYGIGIDFDLLDSIEVTNLSSFAIRGLGFGGKINAVPMLAPNVKWVQPWLDKLNVIQ
ncbi:MAG: hypothetical protein P8X73_12145 [Ignavibacteriaceae bacterium]